MARCKRCGKWGLFLRLSNHLCEECVLELEQETRQKAKNTQNLSTTTAYKSVNQTTVVHSNYEPTSEENAARLRGYSMPEDREIAQKISKMQNSIIVTPFEVFEGGGPPTKRTLTFEERKKTCIPSKNGLYVAEILLLDYCSNCIYPSSNYPAFWWYSYGIMNLSAAMESLMNRGFLKYATAAESLVSLTIPEIKGILASYNLATSGKKADLISRAQQCISEEELRKIFPEPKYTLTELGKQELEENAYVPYMHRSKNKTLEGGDFEFNVWSINRLLGNGDKTNWETVVNQELRKYEKHLGISLRK